MNASKKPPKNMEELSVEGTNCRTVYVNLKKLPSFSELSSEVQAIVASESWWEQYGIDCSILVLAFAGVFVSLGLLGIGSWWAILSGGALFGVCHASLSTKGGHAATHGALVKSPAWNRFWTVFLVELLGSYSAEKAYEIHVKQHHPHTNIIGLGDSSSWKAPMLPKYVYMFFAPLLLPVLTPVVGISQLWGQHRKLVRYLTVMTAGLSVNCCLIMYAAAFTLPAALVCLFTSRAFMAIPYIHINIFQHIGLPMYSQHARPVRLYQMATGVLNLQGNTFLDWCFGHSIISCHVEHHLFPQLSDNMCMKIKPVVGKFFRSRGLPYNEATYLTRLGIFLKNYETLMVKAPSITHFVGLQ